MGAKFFSCTIPSAPARSIATTPAAEVFLCEPYRLKVLLHIDRLGADAHRAENDSDPDTGVFSKPLTAPFQHRLNCVPLGQRTAQMQLRGKPDLGVDQPLRGQQPDQLPGDPGQRTGVLQNLQRQLKPLEILVDAAAVGGDHDKTAKSLEILGRHRNPLLFCQVPGGLGQHRAVKVQVQINFGQRII